MPAAIQVYITIIIVYAHTPEMFHYDNVYALVAYLTYTVINNA